MTDEQILKRMAEIEGVEKKKLPPPYHRQTVYRILDYGVWREWNPLTNWSDLGPLIEKYEVMLWPCDMGWCAECKGIGIDHESLPHAICLAIIEANGGMGDE